MGASIKSPHIIEQQVFQAHNGLARAGVTYQNEGGLAGVNLSRYVARGIHRRVLRIEIISAGVLNHTASRKMAYQRNY